MRKRLFVIFGAISVGLILALIFILFTPRKGFNITIYNNSNTKIEGLTLTYANITKDIEVPSIDPSDKVTLNVQPKEKFNENQMKIKYNNSSGISQASVIIGYFEKGYSGNVTVKISSKEGNQFLDFNVDSDVRP